VSDNSDREYYLACWQLTLGAAEAIAKKHKVPIPLVLHIINDWKDVEKFLVQDCDGRC
jgi:hypothetical protein